MAGLGPVLADRAADASVLPRKVGCALVRDGRQIAAACNSTTRGVAASDPRARGADRYAYVEHAERNAVYAAAAAGVATLGCDAFVTLFPCAECARALVQAGIRSVRCPPPPPVPPTGRRDPDHRWRASWEAAETILREAGVPVVLAPPR